LKGIEMFGKNRYQYLLINFTLHLAALVTDWCGQVQLSPLNRLINIRQFKS
jgi:hypothetical protein